VCGTLVIIGGQSSKALLDPATPAGYWFVKGFEIDKIAGSVDYLNMMCASTQHILKLAWLYP
jgi:hypothetical protein